MPVYSVRHFCAHGKKCFYIVDGQRVLCELVCINPYHLHLGTTKDNRDDVRCEYGSSATCPHNPKHIYTEFRTGKPIPCFSNPASKPECPHNPPCRHYVREELEKKKKSKTKGNIEEKPAQQEEAVLPMEVTTTTTTTTTSTTLVSNEVFEDQIETMGQ